MTDAKAIARTTNAMHAVERAVDDVIPPVDLIADTFTINNDPCPGRCVVHGAGTPRTWDIRKGYGLSGATVVFMGFTVSRFEIDVTIFTQRQFDDWQVFFAKYLRREAVQSNVVSPEAKKAATSKARAAQLTREAQSAYNLAKTQQSNQYLTDVQKRRLEQDATDAANAAREANDQVVTVANEDSAGSSRALGIYYPALAALGIGSMVVEDVTQFEQDDFGAWTCTIKCIEYKKPKPMLLKPNGSIPGIGSKQPTNKDAFDVQLQQAQDDLQHWHDLSARQDAGEDIKF